MQHNVAFTLKIYENPNFLNLLLTWVYAGAIIIEQLKSKHNMGD